MTKKDTRDMTPAERIALVWELTVQEWEDRGVDVRHQGVRRDIVRLIHASKDRHAKDGPDDD